MALGHSTWLYITLALLDSTLLYHGSTSLYFTLHYCIWWLYFTLLDSILLHVHWLYFTPHNSAMALGHSAWLYITLLWLYFTLLDSTVLDFTLLYHGFTSLYLIQLYSIMALLFSTWLYITLPWLFTSLYLTLLYFTMALLYSTCLLYFTLNCMGHGLTTWKCIR